MHQFHRRIQRRKDVYHFLRDTWPNDSSYCRCYVPDRFGLHFCVNMTKHKQWAKEWPKLKSGSTEITHICEALKQAAQERDHNSVSLALS